MNRPAQHGNMPHPPGRGPEREYAVECSGAVRVDPPTVLIPGFRDCLDLELRRTRLGDVLRR